MQRDLEAYLWDVLRAIDQIARYTQNVTLETYLSDDYMQAAVERRLEIIGEALNQAARQFPEQLDSIPSVTQIIAFRNRLAHAYLSTSHHIVWEITQRDLSKLRISVSALLVP